ncbi:MAG: DUF547 domain-containing protein [Elusimicrobia bacterium]|nr:DUF547 domain-containing protein [Elusimicrobiota bacterium]
MRTLGRSLLLVALSALPALAAGFDQTHAVYDRLLHLRVKGDRVDYAGLKDDPAPLDAYLRSLAAVSESEFDSWPKAEREAFIIDLYNASMIRSVVSHYPIASVKDVALFFGVFREPAVHVWGRTMSLKTLETDYARKLGDYRVHFALVCASKGCPPLRAEAYVGRRLDAQLDDQARRFFAQGWKNRVDARDKTLYVSPIFKWFPEDFAARGGAVGIARKFLPEAARRELRPGFAVSYTEYDWSLNDARVPR